MIKRLVEQEKEIEQLKKDEPKNLLNILIILRPYIKTNECPLDVDKLMNGLSMMTR